MVWKIEFAQSAARDLRKLDPQVSQRLVSYLRDRVAPSKDPRALGQALKGDELEQFWKYRVGNFRLIAEIHDRVVRILIVRLGHRSEVYR